MYFEGQCTAIKFLHNVKQLSRTGANDDSPVGLLTTLRDAMENHLPQIRIDWITLNRQCNALMKQLDLEIWAKMKRRYLPVTSENATGCLEFGLHLIHHAAGSDMHAAFRDDKFFVKLPERQRRLLMFVVGDQFRTFITSEVLPEKEPVEPFTVDTVTGLRITGGKK